MTAELSLTPDDEGAGLTITPDGLRLYLGVRSGHDADNPTGAGDPTGDARRVSGRTLVLDRTDVVSVSLDGLQPGSTASLWVRSEPVLLARAEVDADGHLDLEAALPDDLEVGAHTLLVTARRSDGAGVQLAFGVLVAPARFVDVVATSVHGLAIRHIAALGITTGRADGTYAPAESVTRGQMATFLARALRLELGEDEDVEAVADEELSDVAGSVHAAAILAVVDAGIARGYADGRFGVGDPIRRDQMASMLAAAGGLARVDEGPFVDLDGNVHAGAVNAIAQAGITLGVDAEHYAPAASVRRDQMASFLVRLLDHASTVDG